jgi:hypothetical protein
MRTSRDTRQRTLSADTQWRLTFGFVAAILIAPAAIFVTYVALWNLGIDPFGGNGKPADPYDVAGALTAGVAIGAVFITALAGAPGVLWLASRGPLGFRQVMLLGAALGFLFATPALAANDRDMFVRNAIFGVWIGGLAAAAFWVAAVPGSELSASYRPDPEI